MLIHSLNAPAPKTSALFANLLALELWMPTPVQPFVPPIAQMGDTTCYYHIGTLTYAYSQSESTPIHLSHTGAIALLVDAQTQEILTDLDFSTDIYMVIEQKQAFIAQTHRGMTLIIFKETDVYHHFLELIPSTRRNKALENDHHFLEGSKPYV